MVDMIAYCGLDCTQCRAYKATMTGDMKLKNKIAEDWSAQGKTKFKTEDVDCLGCKSEKISGFCRVLCQVRPCAQARQIRTCAHCDEYQCEKLKEFLSADSGGEEASRNLQQIRDSL